MTMDEKIKRINELYHKSQDEGLSDEEKQEHKALRQDYINSVKGNLQSQLDSIRVKQPDGTLEKLRKVKRS